MSALKDVKTLNEQLLEREKLRGKITEFLDSIKSKDLITVISMVRFEIMKRHDKTSDSYFICPITNSVLLKKGSVKIITEHKVTRYNISHSWYYLSKRAYNKIKKRVES